MAFQRNNSVNIDSIGASASLLCAIHCALVPLVLTFGLLGGTSFFTDPFWELILVGASLILASLSFYNGYKRHHQKFGPSIVAFVGFALIGIGHLVLHSVEGHWIAAVGGLSIAFAHYLNYRACNSCKVCRH